MKLHHFVQKMKKNTLKDGLYTKMDAKRDAKSSFCCSVSTMGNEPDFIGLGRIGMVEKMVDEVERRSYLGGSRFQVVHMSRDEGAMKSSFEKLRESSLFLFWSQAPLLSHANRALPGWNCLLIKGYRQWHHSLSRDKRNY